MTEQAEVQAAQGVDLGRALGSLLRDYLDGARLAVDDIPGGPRGFQVMSIAAGGECANQARIAAALGLDRTVMTYLVDDLEGEGLVERRPDPVDRRARQVLLTAKGDDVFTAASARVAEVEGQVLHRLSPDEAATFRDLLVRVTTADAEVHDAHACSIPPA